MQAKLRESRDRLDDSDYQVGFFYFRNRWYQGAIGRLKAVLKRDPQYTRRDAAYFYLGEALIKQQRQAEALPYYEQLVQEFEQSEYLDEARKRITELKAQMAAKAAVTAK